MNEDLIGPSRADVERILRARGLQFGRIHFTPGTDPGTTAEQVADMIERALHDIALGGGQPS